MNFYVNLSFVGWWELKLLDSKYNRTLVVGSLKVSKDNKDLQQFCSWIKVEFWSIVTNMNSNIYPKFGKILRVQEVELYNRIQY